LIAVVPSVVIRLGRRELEPFNTRHPAIKDRILEKLEQRATIDWPDHPRMRNDLPGRVTNTMADVGDLLEQAQAAGTTADDDRPYDSPSQRE
jgi:hypothetical protein